MKNKYKHLITKYRYYRIKHFYISWKLIHVHAAVIKIKQFQLT